MERKMDRERKNALHRNMMLFERDLSLPDILAHLTVLPSFLVDRIRSTTDPVVARRDLVKQIEVRSNKAFDEFYVALMKTGQCQLAGILEPMIGEDIRVSLQNRNEPESERRSRTVSAPVTIGYHPRMAQSPPPPSYGSFLSMSSRSSCSKENLAPDEDDSPMVLTGILQNLSIDGISDDSADNMLQIFNRERKNIYHPNFKSKKGLCLIINNKSFLTYGTRLGTEVDSKNLSNLFNQLGYRVTVMCDLQALDILRAVKEFGRNPEHKYMDSAVVIILTHGEQDVLLGTDEGAVKVDEILGYLNATNAPDLSGKPKFVVIQACRGEKRDYGIAYDAIDGAPVSDGFNPFSCMRPQVEMNTVQYRLPIESDILVAYSTVPNYVSWRNSVTGSWFIQALCEVFSKHARDKDLVDMLTLVNHRVATCRHDKKQQPDFSSRLRKKFFFFPGIERRGSLV